MTSETNCSGLSGFPCDSTGIEAMSVSIAAGAVTLLVVLFLVRKVRAGGIKIKMNSSRLR